MFLELWMHINERCKQGLWKSTWRLFKQRDELWLTGSHVLQRRSEHVFSMKSCLMPCVSLSSAQLPKCLREKSFSVAVMSYIIMRLCFFFFFKALMCWPNNCKTEVYIGRLPPFTFFFFKYKNNSWCVVEYLKKAFLSNEMSFLYKCVNINKIN